MCFVHIRIPCSIYKLLNSGLVFLIHFFWCVAIYIVRALFGKVAWNLKERLSLASNVIDELLSLQLERYRIRGYY